MPLLKLIFEICLLRAGPQQLPASGFLTLLAVASYLLVSLVVLLPGQGLPRAGGEALLDAAVLLLLLRAALVWRRHPARFHQTATALAGSGALLGLLLLPVVGVGAGDGRGTELAALLWLGVFAWSLAVTGHILRHALDLPLAGGVLGAVLYMAVSLALLDLLFPRVA
jgi:hypothetical protein